LYLDAGRTPDAVFHAGEGERLRPDDPAFPALRGEAAMEDGRIDDAIAAFTRERDLDPRRSEAWIHLGRAKLRAGNAEVAAEHFGRAAELAPGDWMPTYLRALAEEQAGRIEEAMDAYRSVLARDDRVAAAHNNLAWLLADRDVDPVLAEVHARRAAELAPDNGDVLGTLGWAQYKNGRLGDAERTLERAVAAVPGDGMKRYLLGVVQLEGGHPEGARKSLLAALERPEGFARAEEARELLERLDR
ncbi:tetratricopeptide repeat protein, partial [bacterium]|nr:tetratricopeptide repeat protein [bacterium]